MVQPFDNNGQPGCLFNASFFFSDNCNGFESFKIMHSHLSQNFAVQGDTSLIHTEDEFAVAEAIHTASSIDTCDPKSSEIAFFLTTVSKSISPGNHHGLIGSNEQSGLGAAKSFRVLQDFLVAVL